MNRKQQNKLLLLVSGVILMSIASALVLYALKQNINLFFTPAELSQAKLKSEQTIRLGGYVEKNSVHYDTTGKIITFVVTDYHDRVLVHYTGILPNLFREGQSVVVTGNMQPNRQLKATEVLAKHDEKYMPKAIAKKLGVL